MEHARALLRVPLVRGPIPHALQTHFLLVACPERLRHRRNRGAAVRRRGRLTGSRPAAVEPVDMMPSRLSGKRPDLMSKEHAEHASLKLDQAAETSEKWTLASGDKKT